VLIVKSNSNSKPWLCITQGCDLRTRIIYVPRAYFLLHAQFTRNLHAICVCHACGKIVLNPGYYGPLEFFGGAVPFPFRTPFSTSYLLLTSVAHCLSATVCGLPFFLPNPFVKDGRSLCPEGSATLCWHGHRSKKSTTKSCYADADESHPKKSGKLCGDVTTVFTGFRDVIYV
jgi:hypothetical protein